jgi:hypothetical protein
MGVIVGGCAYFEERDFMERQSPLREATEAERNQIGAFSGGEEGVYVDFEFEIRDVNDPYLEVPVWMMISWDVKLYGEGAEDGVAVSVTLQTKKQFHDGKFRCVPIWIFVARKEGFEKWDRITVPFEGDWKSSRTLDMNGVSLDLVWRGRKLFARIRLTSDVGRELK